jgi:TonB family protein
MSHSLILPWTPDNKENQRFWIVLALLMLVALPLAVVIPSLNLPKQDRKQLEKLPPQLAKIILKNKVEKKESKKEKVEVPKPKKKEKPKPKKEKPKPKPEKPKPVKKKVRPEIKKAPPPEAVKKARDVAQKSGLLALQDDLADMRSSLDTSSLSEGQTMVAKTIAASAEAVNSSSALKGSGGINTSGMAVPAEKVVLAKRKVTELQKSKAEKQLEVAVENKLRPRERSIQNIRRVFDQKKSSLFFMYNRALRTNPNLSGTVRLELVVEPSGAVSSCKVLSSSLGDKMLEDMIVARVKLFNFGTMHVAAKKFIYPIVFVQP